MMTHVWEERLSRITTLWSLVRQAHGSAGDAASAARRDLLERYCGAAYRYLLGATRNEDTAQELFQEFALRFARGDFRRADPARGRFRDYVKTAIIHLVADYRKSLQNRPHALPADYPAPPASEVEEDAEFNRTWRQELINRSWDALAQINSNYHAILLLHVEHADKQTAELLDMLAARLGKPITHGNARVILHRAREKFAHLLVEEVLHSLNTSDEAELIDELRSLGLLKLCAPALAREGHVVPRDEPTP